MLRTVSISKRITSILGLMLLFISLTELVRQMGELQAVVDNLTRD